MRPRVLISFLLVVAPLAACPRARAHPSTPASTTSPVASAGQLRIDVAETMGARLHDWPITSGVPFPAAAVRDPAQLTLRDEADHPVAVQARTLSRWPDGSVRWALLDWQSDLPGHGTRHFTVTPGATAGVHGGVTVNDRPDRIEVDTGRLQFTVPKKHFAVMENVRLDGQPFPAGPVTTFMNVAGTRSAPGAPLAAAVAEAGPLRARIELRGHYSAAFDYVIRLDAFARHSFVRLFHSFEQHTGEAYTSVRQIGVQIPVPLSGTATYSAGLQGGRPLSGRVGTAGLSLIQEDNETIQIGGRRQRGKAAGWMDVRQATHGLAVLGRFFWQEYPQSLQLTLAGLTYNLWAPEAGDAKVGMGAAKTHELVLYFHGPSAPPAAVLNALRAPVSVRLDPQWVAASGALRNAAAPSPATAAFLAQMGAAFRRYTASADTERWDDSGQVRCPTPGHGTERPRRGFYGMFNWGDWNFPGYHDTTKGCDAWGNLEYDMTQVLALAYAATGEPAYHEQMVAAARHFMDVDRIYYQRDHPNWIGMNHPKNPLHFAFELGGVDLGHTWTEGLLSYYAFTGDERGLDAARGIADYLVHRLRYGIARGNPRQWGWPQIALVAAYEMTGNAAYRSAAQEYARAGMSAYAPDKLGDWKIGILAEALAYTHSVTHDAAIKDWLLRYANAVRARGGAPDPRLFPAVAYVAHLTGDAADRRTALAIVPRLSFGTWGKPFTIAGRIGFSVLSRSQSTP